MLVISNSSDFSFNEEEHIDLFVWWIDFENSRTHGFHLVILVNKYEAIRQPIAIIIYDQTAISRAHSKTD